MGLDSLAAFIETCDITPPNSNKTFNFGSVLLHKWIEKANPTV